MKVQFLLSDNHHLEQNGMIHVNILQLALSFYGHEIHEANFEHYEKYSKYALIQTELISMILIQLAPPCIT